VSATSRDLERAVEEGLFRPDLWHRIDTLIIDMPPLRERREDIAELAAHFACQASSGCASLGSDALDKLRSFDWPGNIRQLRNIVQRAFVLSGYSDEVRAEHIVLR